MRGPPWQASRYHRRARSGRRNLNVESDRVELFGCAAELAQEWQPARVTVQVDEQRLHRDGGQRGIVGCRRLLEPFKGPVGIAAERKYARYRSTPVPPARNTALRAGSDTAGRQGPHRVDGLGQEMCRLGKRGFARHSRGRTGQRSRCGRCIRSREPVSRSFRYPPRGAMCAACSSFRVIFVYALPLGN